MTKKLMLKHSNKHLIILPNNITHVFLLLVHLNLENFLFDSFDEHAFKNYLFFTVYPFFKENSAAIHVASDFNAD